MHKYIHVYNHHPLHPFLYFLINICVLLLYRHNNLYDDKSGIIKRDQLQALVLEPSQVIINIEQDLSTLSEEMKVQYIHIYIILFSNILYLYIYMQTPNIYICLYT